MRVIALIVLALITTVSLAGCVVNPLPSTASAESPTVTAMAAEWYEAPLARDAGHDHRDLSQHQGVSTPNFLLVGHDPLLTRDLNNRYVGSWGCGETGETSDGRKLAILDGFGREATIIADVTDSAHPFKVGEIKIDGVLAWDTTITPDGRWAIIGLDSLLRVPTLGLAAPTRVSASFQNACGGQREIPIPDIAPTSGVMVFDLADPSSPTFADYWSTPAFNMHSVSASIVDGRTYVTASIVNLVPTASYFQFLELLDTPIGGKLVPLSSFAPPPVNSAQGHVFVPTFNGHNDATIQKHPGNGAVYAYLAAWDSGMFTLDITIPQAPVLVANWAPPTSGLISSGLTDSGCYPWALHTTFPFPEMREGKHYLIAGQECVRLSESAPGGELFILDNTDPASPTLVGRWNLPVDTSDAGEWTIDYQASPHYVAMVGKTLLVSMYHAGLWAVDLSGALTAPPTIGMYMPAIPSGVNNPSFAAPVTEQVNVLANGDIVLFENSSGVYVLRFDPTDPAPPALPRFR